MMRTDQEIINDPQKIAEAFSSDNLAEINKCLAAKRKVERDGLVMVLFESSVSGIEGQADAVLESKWLDDYIANQC